MNLVTLIVFGMVSIGISCAFAVFILKHIREYGIMKAMGVTAGETFFFINMEVALLNGTASVMGGGILLVYLFGKTSIDLSSYTSHNPYFTVSGVIYPRLSAMALFFPPCLSLGLGMLSSLWPAVIVLKRKTAEIMRIV